MAALSPPLAVSAGVSPLLRRCCLRIRSSGATRVVLPGRNYVVRNIPLGFERVVRVRLGGCVVRMFCDLGVREVSLLPAVVLPSPIANPNQYNWVRPLRRLSRASGRLTKACSRTGYYLGVATFGSMQVFRASQPRRQCAVGR